MNRCRHRQDPNTLGERGELDNRSHLVAGGPCLVGNHDGVHELLWPGILDLEGLLVFERLGGKGANDGYRHDGLHVVSKTRTYGNGPELVAHMSTTVDATCNA